MNQQNQQNFIANSFFAEDNMNVHSFAEQQQQQQQQDTFNCNRMLNNGNHFHERYSPY